MFAQMTPSLSHTHTLYMPHIHMYVLTYKSTTTLSLSLKHLVYPWSSCPCNKNLSCNVILLFSAYFIKRLSFLLKGEVMWHASNSFHQRPLRSFSSNTLSLLISILPITNVRRYTLSTLKHFIDATHQSSMSLLRIPTNTYLPTHIHSYLHCYLLNYVNTYVLTYQHTYLLTYKQQSRMQLADCVVDPWVKNHSRLRSY